MVDALLGVALFASSVWVQLLYWPGALTPSVLLSAAAIWLLPWAALSRRRLAGWLVAGAACAVLTYPPVGLVLLVFAVVVLRDAPWRRVLLVVAGWIVGFGLGVAVAWSLNWVLNGHFGLQLAVVAPGQPAHLARRARRQRGALAHRDRVAVGRSVVGGARGSRRHRPRPPGRPGASAPPAPPPRLRRRSDSTRPALATGLVTEARGQLWTWLFAVLPVALLLDRKRPRGPRPGRTRPVAGRVATALLLVLAVAGVLAWRDDIGRARPCGCSSPPSRGGHRPRRGHRRPDGRRLPGPPPGVRNTRSGRLMASTLFMAVRVEQGLVPRWCRGDECRELAEHWPPDQS